VTQAMTFMIRERISPSVSLAPVSCTVLMIVVACLSHQAVLAQSSRAKAQPSPSPDNSGSEQSNQSKERKRDPIEDADEHKSKLTLGIYFTPGARAYDLNLRHQFGPFTAWVAGFYDPKSNKLMRVGGQYDYKKGWLHLVPSLEVSTTKAMSGSLSSELGSDKTVFLAGVSRTNLRPFFDLFWDPGDSVQLGIGHRLSSYDRISAFTIFDVRLHTQQQNTHVVWRHKLNRNNGITFDGLFKSGHTDSGEYIRKVGIGVYYDRPKWFWKLHYDPHVNFTNRTMVRTGIGLKF
jgi:hypothetical protein